VFRNGNFRCAIRACCKPNSREEKIETTKISKNNRMAMGRARIIRCAAPMSCGWSAEAHLGVSRSAGRGDFEDSRGLNQHIGKDVGGELLDFRVQVADHAL